jgi:hypothetical protein
LILNSYALICLRRSEGKTLKNRFSKERITNAHHICSSKPFTKIVHLRWVFLQLYVSHLLFSFLPWNCLSKTRLPFHDIAILWQLSCDYLFQNKFQTAAKHRVSRDGHTWSKSITQSANFWGCLAVWTKLACKFWVDTTWDLKPCYRRMKKQNTRTLAKETFVVMELMNMFWIL